MQIIWHQNPLRTKVILNDHEKEIMWHKIRHEELLWKSVGCHHYLERAITALKAKDYENALKDAKEAIDDLDYAAFYNKDGNDSVPGNLSALDERTNMLHESYLEDLNGWHVGDCTCVPCSCGKCHAENLVGVDTLSIDGEYPGKHVLHYVDYAFSKPTPSHKYPNCQTLDEAIEFLSNYTVAPSTHSSDWHAKWEKDAHNAAKYLKKYKQKLTDQNISPIGS